VPASSADADTAMIRESHAVMAARMNPRRTTLFLARLAEACGSPEAAGLLTEAAHGQPASEPWPEMLQYYLVQSPTAGKTHEALPTCRWAYRKWKDRDSRMVALASELLALTLGRPEELVRNAHGVLARILRWCGRLHQFWVLQRSLWTIVSARLRLGGCTRPVQELYRHYEGHFWAKLVEYLDQRSVMRAFGRKLDPLHPLLRRLARALTKPMERMLRRAVDNDDLTLVGNAQALVAEMLILSGSSEEEALKAARRARSYRSVIGIGNNAALGDRLLGWACLASRAPEASEEATRAFARGLWRATHVADTSLWSKLAVELARTMNIDGYTIVPNLGAPTEAIDAIRKACLVLCKPRSRVEGDVTPDDLASARAAVGAFLGYMYREASALDELRKALDTYRDTRRFPMLLSFPAPTSSGPLPMS
jgi:hypothetical protein